MSTGHYQTYSQVKNWDFLANEKVKDLAFPIYPLVGMDNVMTFLHGYCYLFAVALSHIFGYKIVKIVDKNGFLVHAYCVCKKNGKNEYIDARGTTDDKNEMLSEFSGGNSLKTLGYKTVEANTPEIFLERNISTYAAENYIKDHISYYYAT